MPSRRAAASHAAALPFISGRLDCSFSILRCTRRAIDSVTRMSTLRRPDASDTARCDRCPKGSARRLEQFNGVPVRILDLDLATARADFQLVAKAQVRLLQFRDEPWQVGDLEHHSIPAAWLL